MIIAIVRKPLVKNVCKNITLHNTGGINIKETRVLDDLMTSDPSQEGRWPANVLLESTTIIDQQSGITTNTSNYSYKRTGGKFIGGIPSQESKAHWRTETGGASRFFKVVKE